MKKLTLQQIFNTVYRGLRKQKFKRAMSGAICMYVQGDRRCAIGQLITDAEVEALPGGPYYEVKNYLPKRLDALKERRFGGPIGAGLQDCHDDGNSPEEMKRYLKDFAERHKLKVPR